MPFYEYECQACKYYAEVMQKISDTPLTRCPSCGKRTLKKLVSVPVFRLKGSGWYETDFKSDKEGRRNLHGADKEEAKAESKAESKTESKTEAKEAKPAGAETKESKEAKSAPAKPSSGSAATSGGSSRARTRSRTTATRRPARAASKGRPRKPRR
jgi:putative FmdB family regulatory protein